MSVNVSYEKKLPIVIITPQADDNIIESIEDAQRMIAGGLQHFDPPYYRIVDLTDFDIDMGTAAEFLQKETTHDAGTATDLRFVPIYVGADNMVRMIGDSLRQEQYGGVVSYHF